MNFTDELENLIVLLSIVRARLHPRISYPRAEGVSMRIRHTLVESVFDDAVMLAPTLGLVEACSRIAGELVEIMTYAPPTTFRDETGIEGRA
ncbi:hypothetical protein [Acetobacter sp. DsW_063]|uniref:hypothetical protein n=1 Tax=Acetobacter sp. DsW_063 TaxID=1514894 RepID=UPI000A361526|nr:hypothetical protein [Acetobacter sp. DsW_063]OUJ16505.1 hypothetical protein HK28_12595 [Acetobacter sp. DsW_063]